MSSANIDSAISSSAGANGTATDPSLASAFNPVPSSVPASNQGSQGGQVGSGQQILNQILDPTILNLPFLNAITKQTAVLAAATGGNTYGTLSGARPNLQPFIIGFITPDIPPNYTPVSKNKSQIATIQS